MKQRARMSLAVATIVASGWGSVVGVTACGSSSSKNPSGSATDGSSGGSGSSSGGSGGSSGGSGSSGSGSGSSGGGACTINADFGGATSGTCAECASCIQGTTCCTMINDCYADPGCAALINCQLMLCNNNGVLPGNVPVPDGGDCVALCAAAIDAGTTSQQLFMNEDNCWELNGPGSTTCANPCNCAGGDDGGTD